jgi:hypothetical protein
LGLQLRDHRVHPRGIALERGLDLRRHPLPFGARRFAQAECQKAFVDLDRVVAHHLRQPAHRHAAIQLHLPQPIARMEHARGEVRIFGIARVYRGYAMVINQHFDRRGQAGERELSVEHGQRLLRPPISARRGGRNEEDQRQNQEAFEKLFHFD